MTPTGSGDPRSGDPGPGDPTSHDPTSHGAVFDTFAAEYRAHRPGYPDELVDQACADLGPGDPVLEVGCGAGQLTRSLVARGLDVTAIDPGSQLLALAGKELEGMEGVHFVNATFETVELPPGRFEAVFSASAFHWPDPDVSWLRAARALSSGGTLALLQHCGVAADDDQEAQMAAVARIAPEVAAAWPILRPLEAIMAGIADRRDNVSEAWSWVGQYDLGRPSGEMFGEVRAAAIPTVREMTADDVIGALRTLSHYHRMTADQQAALEASMVALQEELGRPHRVTTAAVLVTARKVG